MAFSQWWTFSAGLVESDREQAGVYLFANAAGAIIYVGSSDNVKRRLQEHLNTDNTCIKRNAATYCIDYRGDYLSFEQAVYDDIVRRTGRAPMCNAVRPAGA